MKLTKSTWPQYASAVSCSDGPEAYSPAAMERLMKDMDPFVVKIRGIKPQFRAYNSTQLLNFRCQQDKDFYDEAYERYLREKAKIESRSDGGNKMDILVQLIKFQQAAELIKAPYIAQAMFEGVQNGKATIAGFKYKASIGRLVKCLHDDYNVSRDNISLIWGGGNTSVSKKKKDKLTLKSKLESNSSLMDILKEGGIDLYDLGLGSVSEANVVEVDDTLKLGAQSQEERQKEIDRFQRGKSLYAAFTFKSGGVGLSLHHTDELTTEYNRLTKGYDEWMNKLLGLPPSKRPSNGKARRKESGYAVEEDIPYIFTRPREAHLAVTYSAIELVQALGRAPRLTSLSDTYQIVSFFRDTIEERIAQVVSIKLRCLKKVTRGNKESWEDVILGADASTHMDNTKLLSDGASEDEDEILVADDTEEE